MKKIVLTLLSLAFVFGAAAQSEFTPDQRRASILNQFHKRDISQQHLQSKYQLGPATKGVDVKAPNTSSMPQDRWFPGEWEEVKAIVVTCYYDYYPANHVNDQYWTADPQVTGVADYYKYGSTGWTEQGSGAYVGIPDTTSSFGKVFFYIMDAIQLGGAEAWVRVEQLADSSIILRTLGRMGLQNNNVRFIEGPGNSFWYRDCGPIAFYYGDQDSLAMADFEYYPGRALDDSLPSLIEQQMGIPNYINSIEWEGGNCLVDGTGMLVTSDAIYSNNMDTYGQLTWDGVNASSIHYTTKAKLTKAQVKDSLASIISPRATYIIPAFKYDGGTGHIDLYADMWEENCFVFSKFPEVYSNWKDYKTAEKNIDSLCSYRSYFDINYKKAFIPFPCTNNGGNFSSQSVYNSNYTRTYSNHTFVNNLIIQPCFSTVTDGQPTKAWDRERIDSLKAAYPGYFIYPINVSEFDGTGGAIHCVTKQIPADNPIRILHPSLTGNTESAYTNANAPISAIITNRSGIASAKIMYRFNGGDWQEAPMTAGADNQFNGTIPTAGYSYSGDFATVDYYISATSNNGKTMTKPITSGLGGCYTFYLGTNPDHVGIQAANEAAFGQFYPNPSSSQANIVIDLQQGRSYQVSIVDAMGRICHSSMLRADGTICYTIDCQKLAKGVYTVVFANENSQVSRRLVVE